LAPIGFPAAGFATPGFAAIAFDSAAAWATDFAAPAGFNGFDGALCDVLNDALSVFPVAFSLDFPADGERVFADGFFAVVFAAARVAFAVDGLGDFLRVFLDIRLPFVAFGRSIMGYCGSCPVGRSFESVAGQGGWPRSMVTKQFDTLSVRSLNVPLGPDDE
jgi:hypothetical protein